MTEPTPTPQENLEKPAADLAGEPAAAEQETLEKRPLAAPHITTKRKILAVALAVAATGYLVAVKHGAEQDKKTQDVVKSLSAQQRNVMNGEIRDAMEKHYGGMSDKREQVALVTRVGTSIATTSDAKNSTIKFKFHLLAEKDSINMYALSSGDIYVTTALLNRMQTEGQLAAVLAHGVAHVIAADMATPLAQPKHPLPLWQYTVDQERAADALGLKLMGQTGYNPNAMSGMLTLLAKAYNAGADVAFFTTHPNVPDRLAALDATIKTLYPTGLPAVMSK